MDAGRIRRRRRWLLAYAAGGALVATGAIVAFGPAAPWVVDQLGDGSRVWRLGHIELEGVKGRWLGALRADRVTIEDEEGVWIEARDVTLRWRPHEILFGRVDIDAASANSVVILRRPTLLERRPSSDVDYDVRIRALHVDALTLAEDVVGESAAFVADFAMNLQDMDLLSLEATLRREDSDDDRLRAIYRTGADYTLDVDIYSAPGGVLARALGVPEQGLTATAEGDGDAQLGEAQYQASVGDIELLTGKARWDRGRWSTEAQGRLDVLPFSASLARRIGASVALNAAGARVGDFTVHAETPFLTLDLSGELDEERELVGPAEIVATSDNLSRIARESPFDLGPARLEGQLRRARGTTAVRGTLTVGDIEALGETTRMSGQAAAALTEERFTLESDLRAPEQRGGLFSNALLRVALTYDRELGRFTLDRAALTGDAVMATAQGFATRGEGEFSGEWRVRQLAAVSADLSGEAGGDWRAFRTESEAAAQRVWAISVAGEGAGVSGEPAVIPQLLGRSPSLDARVLYENRGFTVSHARIHGDQLRAGATGRIVGGQADLAVEASARGPLSIGGALISGALDATGRLTGRIARPTLSARASLSRFSAGGFAIDQPTTDFTLAPSGDRYAGQIQVRGSYSGEPLLASSNISIGEGGVALSSLEAQLAALEAQGSARFGSRGVHADLELGGRIDGLAPGMAGNLSGQVQLTPETLQLTAYIANARVGDLQVRAATVRAGGPLEAVALQYELRGRLNQAPLAFGGTGVMDAADGPITVSLDGRGELAGTEFFTRAPIQARFGDPLQASLNVALGQGVLQAQWQERGRAVSGSAQLENAPLQPLAAIWGEDAEGDVDGALTLTTERGGLSGRAALELQNARLAGRQRGRLNMRILAELDPSRLEASVRARSTDGLVADFEASAPVVTSADPIRIALAPQRRGRGRWSIQGPAQSLWAAAQLQDQSLEGSVDGEGELSFGAGYLSGSGYVEIVDGRFEDKLTGIILVDLDARIGFGERGVFIENFTASGPRGGRLTATGGSANQRQGRIEINIENMLVADRPEARARASGQLALNWEGLEADVTGELNILEANIDIAASREEGIPVIEVVEINRPGIPDEVVETEDVLEEERREEEERLAGLGEVATELNVRVRAPGQVFTRGRGLDAEWALDLRLEGTRRNPQVFGEARLIRGRVSLSGQPFEIDEARLVFAGDPANARINMLATRTTPDLTAYMRLTGTASEPEIMFTSDPALPEDEILPQVLFGRSVTDLSAFEAAQLASSLAALSGRASFDLLDTARAAAGLDRFDIRQDEAGGLLVAGGVYLTRNVYFEVARTGLGQAQTRVEWTIRPRLVLITSFLGNGDQRVSLRWRRESD